MTSTEFHELLEDETEPDGTPLHDAVDTCPCDVARRARLEVMIDERDT